MKRLIIQSAPEGESSEWLKACVHSVRMYAGHIGAAYRFQGDSLFDLLPEQLRNKYDNQKVIMSDLARILWMDQTFKRGTFDQIIWFDADMFVFNRTCLHPGNNSFEPGREVWIDRCKDTGKLKAFKKVHNAYLAVRRGDTTLPFYIDAAMRMLERATLPLVPQFIGPKFLTALHNMVHFPVQESAGVASPAVLDDIIKGDRAALAMMKKGHEAPLAALNLCRSLMQDEARAIKVITRLEADTLF